jgi:UDP-glucose 4-epimerase
MMPKKILITGSSGQIGSHLVEYFSKKYEVVGLDVKLSSIPSVNKVTVEGDIRNKNLVNELLKGVDVVIHTAAQLSINRSLENPILDADINIMGTLNLLDATRKNKNISKFVYLSSSVVYGNPEYLPIDEDHPLNPVSAYGLSKLTGEKYCFLFNKVFGLPIVCVRPFNIYSNREDTNSSYVSIISKFNDMVRNNKPLIIYGDGKQMRDLVHVKDVASFIEIVLERSETVGEVYNLGSGKPVTILEIAKLVLKMNEKDEKGNIIYEKEEKGKIEHSYADIRKSRKIGYKPQITIDEGIKDIVNSLKSN